MTDEEKIPATKGTLTFYNKSIDENRGKLGDHEKRIVVLESR